MIDFGFDKIALIGAVALIVIGPEKLPRVARTVGHLLGKAQRYVADVKAEVNRSIELEELKKMKTAVRGRGARCRADGLERDPPDQRVELERAWNELRRRALPPDSGQHDGLAPPPPQYKHPKKHWRLKRGAMPQWYKQRHGVRAQGAVGRRARGALPAAARRRPDADERARRADARRTRGHRAALRLPPGRAARPADPRADRGRRRPSACWPSGPGRAACTTCSPRRWWPTCRRAPR